MTEHEPECWCRGCTHPHVCGRCRNCICDELRACKQRVLDAAREAVNGLEPLLDVEERNGGYDCCGCTTPSTLLEDALAAMRALQEKP